MKRLVCILLLITAFVAIIFISSCAKRTDDGMDMYRKLLESISKGKAENISEESFAQKVYIIIPKACSGELSAKAQELAVAITEKTGVYAIVKYDNEDIRVQDGELTMLLGNTDRLESKEATKLLRYEDYICKWDRFSIVLGGRYDQATINAIDVFMESVLHGASRASLMNADAHFENILDYDVSAVTVNGYDLYDYTLVYSEKNALNEREKAEVLRRYIVAKSGYMLNVMSDAEVDNNTGKIISVCGKTGTEVAGISVEENNIFISGKGEYELSVAISKFAEKLFGSITDGNAVLSIGDTSFSCSSKELKIGYAFSRCAEEYSLDFIDECSRKIQNGGFDVIIFDRTDKWFLQYVNSIKGSYNYILSSDANENAFFVLYNPSVIKSIRCEMSDENIVISFTAAGESEQRRIVRSLAHAQEALGSVFESSNDYDAFILSGNLTQETIDNQELSYIGQEKWTYADGQYSAVVYSKKGLSVTSKLKTDVSNQERYVNLFLSFGLKLKSCAEFERLKY